MLTFKSLFAIISALCESGGIGRRARLRGVWGDSYGFKSRLSHQRNEQPKGCSFFFGANDVCLRQMMLASPMMLAYANDVLLRKMIGKHRIIASETSNIIMNEVNNIIMNEVNNIIFEQSEKHHFDLHKI